MHPPEDTRGISRKNMIIDGNPKYWGSSSVRKPSPGIGQVFTNIPFLARVDEDITLDCHRFYVNNSKFSSCCDGVSVFLGEMNDIQIDYFVVGMYNVLYLLKHEPSTTPRNDPIAEFTFSEAITSVAFIQQAAAMGRLVCLVGLANGAVSILDLERAKFVNQIKSFIDSEIIGFAVDTARLSRDNIFRGEFWAIFANGVALAFDMRYVENHSSVNLRKISSIVYPLKGEKNPTKMVKVGGGMSISRIRHSFTSGILLVIPCDSHAIAFDFPSFEAAPVSIPLSYVLPEQAFVHPDMAVVATQDNMIRLCISSDQEQYRFIGSSAWSVLLFRFSGSPDGKTSDHFIGSVNHNGQICIWSATRSALEMTLMNDHVAYPLFDERLTNNYIFCASVSTPSDFSEFFQLSMCFVSAKSAKIVRLGYFVSDDIRESDLQAAGIGSLVTPSPISFNELDSMATLPLEFDDKVYIDNEDEEDNEDDDYYYNTTSSSE
ncbi:hypothetical protein PCE1_004423 [Barthelona sp. PCE]